MSDAPGKCFYHDGQVPNITEDVQSRSNSLVHLIVDLKHPHNLLVHLIVDLKLTCPSYCRPRPDCPPCHGNEPAWQDRRLQQHPDNCHQTLPATTQKLKLIECKNILKQPEINDGNVYLLPLGVGKHLISAQTVAIAHSHLWSVCWNYIFSSGFSSSPLRHFSFPWCPNNCGLRRSSSLPGRNSQEASGTQDTRAPGTTLQFIFTSSQLSFSLVLLF